MIQIENVSLESIKIHKTKEMTRLEYLKEFSKLSDQEKLLNNKVQEKNALFWKQICTMESFACRLFPLEPPFQSFFCAWP